VRRRIVSILAVVAAAVLVAGCADSGFHYVKSSADKTYFKVPQDWTLYDEGAVLDFLGDKLTDAERLNEIADTWRVAFDAAPKPSLRHLGTARADYPAGLAVVRSLNFDAADTVSNETLRNIFFDVDVGLEDGSAEMLAYDTLELDGGFRGIRFVARLDQDGAPMTINQTVLLDQATTKLYGLVLACSDVCYEDHRTKIEKVAESWTVRD